jgi:nucleoside-diphosphate-sugar epimerase
MKILITGNMGYIGPGVVSQLRSTFPKSTLVGYDMAYFAPCLTNATVLPENKLDVQLFGDVRTMPASVLEGVNVVIYLSAISNDPMGMRFEDITLDVNYKSTIRIAQMAKEAGVSSFVFASSCSIYGAAGEKPKTENDSLNPLTAYARSKVYSERDLKDLADKDFTVTCLRFATACGWSDRLRLDLVLNDFVAGAVAFGQLDILSDGSPWRPLIHVKDMARAIEWGVTREASNGGEFLTVNTGHNEGNYQVKDLARAVTETIPGTEVKINKDAGPDKRSYCANFDLFKSLAPHHQPIYTLEKTTKELYDNLKAIEFKDRDFRNSRLIRLRVLTELKEAEYINDNLEWLHQKRKISDQSAILATS